MKYKYSIFYSDCRADSRNCCYKHQIIITDEKSLAKAVAHDYVCAKYKDNRRGNDNFILSDCLAMDVDNDYSENLVDWVNPEIIAQVFSGVEFSVHFSRNHMKEKGDRVPRPKFHVFFPITQITDADVYSAMKKELVKIFPCFDKNATDAARFFYGTEDANVAVFPGTMMMTDWLTFNQKVHI